MQQQQQQQHASRPSPDPIPVEERSVGRVSTDPTPGAALALLVLRSALVGDNTTIYSGEAYAVEYDPRRADRQSLEGYLRMVVEGFIEDTDEGQAIATTNSYYGYFSWRDAVDHIPDAFWAKYGIYHVRYWGPAILVNDEDNLAPAYDPGPEYDDDGEILPPRRAYQAEDEDVGGEAWGVPTRVQRA